MRWVLLAVALAAAARAEDLRALNAQAAKLYYQGRYAEAEALLAPSAHWPESATDAEQRATALNDLAAIVASQRRWGEAEKLAREALSIRDAAGGPAKELATTLSNLAEILRAQGRYAEAGPLQERSGKLHGDRGKDEIGVAKSLKKLAAVRAAQGRFDEATALLKKALAAREKLHGPTHPKVAEYLKALGELYLSQGRLDEATPLYDRASAIERKHGTPREALPTDVNVPFSVDRIIEIPRVPSPPVQLPPARRGAVPPAPPFRPPTSPTSVTLPVHVLTRFPDSAALAALAQAGPRHWVIDETRFASSEDSAALAALPGRVSILVSTSVAPSPHEVAVMQSLKASIAVILTHYPDPGENEALRSLSPRLTDVALTGRSQLLRGVPVAQPYYLYAEARRAPAGLPYPRPEEMTRLDALPVAPVVVVLTKRFSGGDAAQLARIRGDALVILTCLGGLDDSASAMLDQLDRPLELFTPIIARFPRSARIRVNTGTSFTDEALHDLMLRRLANRG